MPNARRSSKIKNEFPDFQGKYAGDISLTEALLKEREKEIIQEQSEAETVPVRLMKSLIVKVIGAVTGNIYIFNGAGSIVNVDKLDMENINKKNYVHNSCCGSYSSPYFDIL